MVFKKIIFQNRYVALETASRPPPLHSKYHLKFPFWLLEHLSKTTSKEKVDRTSRSVSRSGSNTSDKCFQRLISTTQYLGCKLFWWKTLAIIVWLWAPEEIFLKIYFKLCISSFSLKLNTSSARMLTVYIMSNFFQLQKSPFLHTACCCPVTNGSDGGIAEE